MVGVGLEAALEGRKEMAGIWFGLSVTGLNPSLCWEGASSMDIYLGSSLVMVVCA